MTPQSIISNQLAFQGPQQSSQDLPKKREPKSTLGGLKELDLAKRSETDTQELERDNT